MNAETTASRPTVKARTISWVAYCPDAECDGLIPTDGGRLEWNKLDFNAKGKARGCCATCGRLVIVQR